ncbi:MAG: tetratricopeptide repeat protein [Armatimonadota bacterium]|nr:tetratricopeptide repeat protein [Armatimonadota bacterium]
MDRIRLVLSSSAAFVILLVGHAACSASSPDAFAEGLALFNRGELAHAASRLAAAAAERPHDAAVRLTAGVALANLKLYQEAAEHFEAVVRANSEVSIAGFLLEALYVEMGQRVKTGGTASGGADTAASRELLARALLKYPQNAIAHVLLGDLYQLEGKFDSAKREYELARNLAPKWPKPVFNLGLAHLRTDPVLAEWDFRTAIAMDPSSRRAYLWLGDALAAQNRFEDAFQAYRTAASDDSLFAEAQTRIGNIYLRLGNLRLAEEAFALAAAKSSDARPIAGQAQVFQSQGLLRHAERKYAEASDILALNKAPAPARAVVQRQLGVVQLEQGKLTEALTNLQRSYELHPTLDNASAVAAAQMEAGKLSEAVAQAEERLAREPKSTAVMVYLLAAYRVSGDHSQRIRIAKLLEKVDPAGSVVWSTEIGEAQAALGAIQESLDAYAEALEAGDVSSWAVVARSARSAGVLRQLSERFENMMRTSPSEKTALILYELRAAGQDTEGLVSVAERLVSLYPDRTTNWLRLGQAYEQAGRKDQAVGAYLRAAAGSDPDVAAAARARVESLRKADDAQNP